MDIKGIAEAYASIYEAKKKDDEKPKKWHDDDGDGISYEDGEVDGKFPDKDGSKKKKKKKEDVKESKKADKDYDGDGKVESGAKEHAGAVHNAIQKKKGLKPDGKDTRKEEVEMDEATLATARKNIGRDPKKKSCWDGYKATGTKMKGGKAVPDCKKEENETLFALLDTLEEGVEIDKFDVVLAYLIDEQIAEDFDGASKAMTSLSESLVNQIFEQQKKFIAWNQFDENYHAMRNPEKYAEKPESEMSYDERRKKRMNDPKKGINSPAFKKFMADRGM